jgi:hypothetical protein
MLLSGMGDVTSTDIAPSSPSSPTTSLAVAAPTTTLSLPMIAIGATAILFGLIYFGGRRELSRGRL